MNNLSKYYKPSDWQTHADIADKAEKFMRENTLKVYGSVHAECIVFFPKEDFSDYLFDDTDVKQFDSFLLNIFSLNKIQSIQYKMVILQNIEKSKFRFTGYTIDFRQWIDLGAETELPNKALALCHASIVKPATTFSKKISFENIANGLREQGAYAPGLLLKLIKKGNKEPIHFEINKTEEDWYSVRQFVFVGGFAKSKTFVCDGLKGVFKLIESFIV